MSSARYVPFESLVMEVTLYNCSPSLYHVTSGSAAAMTTNRKLTLESFLATLSWFVGLILGALPPEEIKDIQLHEVINC